MLHSYPPRRSSNLTPTATATATRTEFIANCCESENSCSRPAQALCPLSMLSYPRPYECATDGRCEIPEPTPTPSAPCIPTPDCLPCFHAICDRYDCPHQCGCDGPTPVPTCTPGAVCVPGETQVCDYHCGTDQCTACHCVPGDTLTPTATATATPSCGESPPPTCSPGELICHDPRCAIGCSCASRTPTPTLSARPATPTQTPQLATPTVTPTCPSGIDPFPPKCSVGQVLTCNDAPCGGGCSCATRTTVPTPSAGACVGDCNGDGVVAINELITGVNIELGTAPLNTCPAFAFDCGQPLAVLPGICCAIDAVNNSLEGCSQPTPVSPHLALNLEINALPDQQQVEIVATLDHLGGATVSYVTGCSAQCYPEILKPLSFELVGRDGPVIVYDCGGALYCPEGLTALSAGQSIQQTLSVTGIAFENQCDFSSPIGFDGCTQTQLAPGPYRVTATFSYGIGSDFPEYSL